MKNQKQKLSKQFLSVDNVVICIIIIVYVLLGIYTSIYPPNDPLTACGELVIFIAGLYIVGYFKNGN